MPNGLHFGQRISFDGNLCTVRYIGQVHGTKGEWLGVEWDDPERGKHNGTVGDVNYFACLSNSPTAASFVRQSRPRDPPRTFFEAVHHKYASDKSLESDVAASAADNVITISGKDVEEVGFDKIRLQLANLQELRIVVLYNLRIGRSLLNGDRDEEGDLVKEHRKQADSLVAKGAAETCPNAVELDISCNLFECWNEIRAIISQLPELTSLNVSGNRMSYVGNEDLEDMNEQAPFSTLRTINLENCLLNWHEISRIMGHFSSLKSAALGSNQLSRIDTNLPYKQLTSISLDQNEFKWLDQLRPLSNLKNLQRLNLKNNLLKSIYDPMSDNISGSKLRFSESLQDVDLSFNNIDSWEVIDELANVFPGLTALRTSSNPFYERSANARDSNQTTDEAFIMTVARLAQLTTLNFSQVTPKIRHDAEAFYFSQIGKELSANPAEEASVIISNHPRYNDLCSKLGEPVVVRTKDQTANQNNLGKRLVHCTFSVESGVLDFAGSSSASSTARTWEVEIPQSYTVYNVLGMVGKHFNIVPMLLKLVWETDEDTMALDAGYQSGERPLKESESPKLLKEETLEPRTRRIGTWLETGAARIRVELSEDEMKHRQTAQTALAS